MGGAEDRGQFYCPEEEMLAERNSSSERGLKQLLHQMLTASRTTGHQLKRGGGGGAGGDFLM